MTAVTEIISHLGPPIEGSDALKLTGHGAEVTVTEHEGGWSIIGEARTRSTERNGPFVGTVTRCTQEACRCALYPYGHRRTQACPHERTCLGHADKVCKLARSILNTYKASA